MPRPPALAPFVAATIVLTLACGGDPAAPPAAASVAIRTAASVRVGDTVTLAAVVRRADGGVLQGRTVTWRGDTPAIATVVGDRLVGVEPGLARVIATVDGLVDTASVRVDANPVASIVASPAELDLYAGDSARLAFTMRDAAGRVVTGRVPTAHSYVNEAAYLKTDGYVHARAVGAKELYVTVDGASVRVPVRVTRHPDTILRFLQRRLVLEPGARPAFSVVEVRPGGRTVSVSATALASTDSAVVGLAPSSSPFPSPVWTARSTGSANVIASLQGLTATLPIDVVARPTSEFDVDVRRMGDASAAVDTAVVRAVARWRRVVVGDVPAQRVVLPEGACFPGSPAMDEVVDDLLVWIYVGPYDGTGGVLAEAGPCAQRDAGPSIVGVVRLDAADIGAQSTSRLEAVVAHEIGHILGIGTTWDPFLGGTSADPHYVGPAARLAAGDHGFVAMEHAGIPLELGGGPGTAGAHWRATALPRELMTGWVDGGTMPLSHMTVGVLRDLGYGVHPAGAEQMTPPTPTTIGVSARVEAPPAGAAPIAERVHGTTWIIGRDGKPRERRRP